MPFSRQVLMGNWQFQGTNMKIQVGFIVIHTPENNFRIYPECESQQKQIHGCVKYGTNRWAAVRVLKDVCLRRGWSRCRCGGLWRYQWQRDLVRISQFASSDQVCTAEGLNASHWGTVVLAQEIRNRVTMEEKDESNRSNIKCFASESIHELKATAGNGSLVLSQVKII